MTDDTTRKPLGQIARAQYMGADFWPSLAGNSRRAWEAVAAKVEAAVLEEITRSGHKVVPVEPTSEQHLAGATQQSHGGNHEDIYEAMLEAAPEYKPAA